VVSTTTAVLLFKLDWQLFSVPELVP
jgi:hypothetical protein